MLAHRSPRALALLRTDCCIHSLSAAEMQVCPYSTTAALSIVHADKDPWVLRSTTYANQFTSAECALNTLLLPQHPAPVQSVPARHRHQCIKPQLRAYQEVPALAQLAHPLLHLVLAAQAALQDLQVRHTQPAGAEHGHLEVHADGWAGPGLALLGG